MQVSKTAAYLKNVHFIYMTVYNVISYRYIYTFNTLIGKKDVMYTSSINITSHSKTTFNIMDYLGYTFKGERLTMWTEPLFLVFQYSFCNMNT